MTFVTLVLAFALKELREKLAALFFMNAAIDLRFVMTKVLLKITLAALHRAGFGITRAVI